jgi:hypothetical protein
MEIIMKVKQLAALLANEDPEAEVIVAGFETTASAHAAEADSVLRCKVISCTESSMMGNKKLAADGQSAVWIGWSKDYRTDSFIDAIANPAEYS